MFDNFLSALGDRFRQQYPQGSIVSDLVQIHGDQYVVKVSVSSANSVLVSTLAVDANLALAENRAIERALNILGIREVQQSPHEVAAVSAIAEVPISISVGISGEYPVEPDNQPSFAEPDEEITTPIVNGQTAAALLPEIPMPELELVVEATIEKAEVAAEPSPADSFEPLDEAPIAEPQLSVTDMIPMINMELKRLGWSKDRGRDYMVSLYNKRASALLSDDELFGLLQHLRAELIV